MPIWKGHGKNMLSCILLTNSLKSPNSFVTGGPYPKQLVIACYCLHQRKHTPASANSELLALSFKAFPRNIFVIRMQQHYYHESAPGEHRVQTS